MIEIHNGLLILGRKPDSYIIVHNNEDDKNIIELERNGKRGFYFRKVYISRLIYEALEKLWEVEK